MNKLKRITVTRTWEPITKTIVSCKECPWFKTENDGNMTLCCCQHPDYNPKKELYGDVIDDIGKPWDDIVKISSKCPYILSEENTKLVWRHNLIKK